MISSNIAKTITKHIRLHTELNEYEFISVDEIAIQAS